MAYLREPGEPQVPTPLPTPGELLQFEAEFAGYEPFLIEGLPIVNRQTLGGWEYRDTYTFDGLSIVAHEAVAYKHIHQVPHVSAELWNIRERLGESLALNARFMVVELSSNTDLGFLKRPVIPAEFAKPIVDAVKLYSPDVHDKIIDMLAEFVDHGMKAIFPAMLPDSIVRLMKEEITTYNDTGKSNADFVAELLERSKRLRLESTGLS